MGDYVPLTNDLLFHMVFSKNTEALKGLLSCLLNLTVSEIEEVVLLNPMEYSDSFDTKQSILDLKLHLSSGTYVHVEMQVRNFAFWTNRTLIYASRQISDQSIRKDAYRNLEPVIQISIMNYTLFPEHRRFFAKYKLQDDELHVYSDKLQFFVLDLTAISLATEKDRDQGLVQWAEAFKAQSWEELEKIQNTGVKEALKTMRVIMGTPSERQLIFDRQIWEMDQASLLQDAREEGITIGEERGIEKGITIGEERGIEKGVDIAMIAAIKNLRETMHLSTKEAMNAMRIPLADQARYEAALQ